MRHTIITVLCTLLVASGAHAAPKRAKKGKKAPAAATQPAIPPAQPVETAPPPAATTTTAPGAGTAPAATTAAPATAPGHALSATPAVSPPPAAPAGGGPSGQPSHSQGTREPAPGLVAAPDGPVMPPERKDLLGLAVALKAGGTYPTSKLGLTYMGALEVSYDLPVLQQLLDGGRLAVGAELGYLQPKVSGTSTSTAVGGSYDYSLSQRLLTVSLDVLVSYPIFGVKPYAGLGWGFYFLRAQSTMQDRTNTETQTRSGLEARGGAGFPLGPGDVFAELRYHWVGLEFLSTGTANAGGITLAAGYRYSL